MIVTIKGLQKDGSDDLTDINVNQKLQKIQQTIQSYDTATAVNVFNNDKGPNNATNMIWPAFKGFPFEMFFWSIDNRLLWTGVYGQVTRVRPTTFIS